MDIEKVYEEACKDINYGKYEIAEENLRKILDEDPLFLKAYNKIGATYALRGDLATAKQIFLKGLEKNNNYAPLLVNVGNIYLEMSDYNKSKDYYDLAIKADPDYEFTYYHLAIWYKKQGDYSTYTKYLKEFRKLDNQNCKSESFKSDENKSFKITPKTKKNIIFICVLAAILIIFNIINK